MKISTYGFTLTLANGSQSMQAALERMLSMQGTPYDVTRVPRRVYVAMEGGLWHLVVLSIRDASKFFQMTTEDSTEVLIGDLANGTRFLDLNISVIDPATLRGTYLHYHHSLGMVGFFHVLDQILRQAAQERMLRLAAEGRAHSVEYKALKKCALKGEIAIRQGKVDDLIVEFGTVKWVTCGFYRMKADAPSASILSAKAAKVSLNVKYHLDGVDRPTVVEGIMQLLQTPSRSKRGLRVGGLDRDGKRIDPRNIDAPKVALSQFDLAEVIGDLRKLDLASIASFPLFGEMREQLMRQNADW